MELFTPKLQYSYIIVLVDNSKFSSVRSQYSLKGICLSTTKFCGRGAVFLEWKGGGGNFPRGSCPDTVKEKLKIQKIRCTIYILIQKGLILRKMQVTLKAFPPRFFILFSLSPNRKKRVVMRVMRKKLNLIKLQLPIQ